MNLNCDAPTGHLREGVCQANQ